MLAEPPPDPFGQLLGVEVVEVGDGRARVEPRAGHPGLSKPATVMPNQVTDTEHRPA
jgi:hypothetical protein